MQLDLRSENETVDSVVPGIVFLIYSPATATPFPAPSSVSFGRADPRKEGEIEPVPYSYIGAIFRREDTSSGPVPKVAPTLLNSVGGSPSLHEIRILVERWGSTCNRIEPVKDRDLVGWSSRALNHAGTSNHLQDRRSRWDPWAL